MNETTARRPKTVRQKVPPFARYKGTSAWRKDRNRVREYNRFRATAARIADDAASSGN